MATKFKLHFRASLDYFAQLLERTM